MLETKRNANMKLCCIRGALGSSLLHFPRSLQALHLLYRYYFLLALGAGIAAFDRFRKEPTRSV